MSKPNRLSSANSADRRSRRSRTSRTAADWKGHLRRPQLELLEDRNLLAVAQTYFIPLPEDQIRTSLTQLYTATGNVIDSTISLLPAQNSEIIYYDQWEDGYEADIESPTQSTTQVWGDNNPANGMPPGFVQDVLTASSVIVLRNNLTVPRSAATIAYDGRDKVAASAAVAVNRAAWATNPGPVLSGAIEIVSTNYWGTNFVVPAGQNAPNSGFNQAFEYTSLLLQAGQDGTTLAIDRDGNGTVDLNVTLNQGESYQLNGGVMTGASVTSSAPIQAHIIAGDIGTQYESDWFTLYPRSSWGSTYYNPVGTTSSADPAATFLYNPNNTPITVFYDTLAGTSSVVVPAASDATTHGAVRVQMPANSGAKFYTTGAPAPAFFALGAVDTDTAGAGNNVRDWGFTLVPDSYLTPALKVGWAPGTGDQPISGNGSPVWVMAASPTRIYVDYDGNGETGAQVDPNGRRYDVHFDVSSYQSVRVFDPDKDQTGMRLYTTTGVKLAGAWGEDPLASQAGNPYLDVGYTVLPLPLFYIQKSGVIIGGDGDAYADPGETIEYSIDIRNEGVLPIENIVVTDPFPANVTYVAGSATIGDASGSPPPVAIPDDASGTAYPLDGAGYSLTSLAVGAIKRLSFRVTVNTPLPSGTSFITNTAFATSSEGPLSATSIIPVQPATPPTCGTILFTDSSFTSAASYNENGTAYVQVSDADANANSSTVDTITVVVTNPTTADRETITLTESGANTGIFRGSLATSTSIGQSVENGTLYALIGNTIAVNYADTTCVGGGVSDTATIVAPAVTKYLYLDVDAAAGDTTGELDRVDPVATNDNTTASTSIIAPANAITVAGTDSGSTSNASTLNISHNPGTGANRLLLVSIALGATTAGGSVNSVMSVKLGSVDLTQVGVLKPSADDGLVVYLYALKNPTSGSQTVAITTQSPSSIAAGATTFNNVDQTTPYGAFEGIARNQNSNDLPEVNIPSAAGELVYSIGAFDEGGSNQSITTGLGQTQLWRFSGLNYVSAAASTRAGASSSVLMSYSATDDQEFAVGGVSLKPATGTATVTFTQTPAFASNFTLPAGQSLGVSTYVTVTSGTMPASPSITATLKYGSTTVATMSNPTYNSGTGLLSWSYSIPSDITIPANSTLVLDITSSQAGVGFTVDYDSSTKPSKITLPTSTYIDITSFGIYDAPYTNDGNSANDGNLVTTALSGQTVYVRGLVTDPFGDSDITSGSINISPSPGVVNPTAIVPTGTLGQKIYEYAWTTGVPQGNFTVTLRADEGYEGTVYDTVGTPFTVIQQDLGTPSITEFTAGLNGPGTLTYPTNTPICVRVTDIDQNTNPTVAETVDAVIHSSSGDDELVTLTETGVNTGVFAFCIPASATTVGADNDGTLYAPNLAALTVVYVDPNDSSDTSSDNASVGTPTGSPPDAKDDNVATNEDTAVTFNVISNSPAVAGVVVDTDPDNDVLTIVGYTDPSHGTISVSSNGSVTYTPDSNYFGTDTFTYTITDGHGGVDTATVTITIASVNDPPDANDDQFSTRHNTPLSITPTGILVNDTDTEGDSLSIVQIQGTAIVIGQTYATSQSGTVKANANGTFTYTPANGFSGADTFTYQISDGNGGFDTATVTILVDPPGTIGDLVWFDLDADGVVDTDEPGIGSVQVFLDTNNNGVLDWTDANSNLQWDAGEGERWTRTNASGGYSFGNLPTGSYVVRVATSTLPAGMQATYDANGGLDSVSSLTITSASLTNNAQDFGYRGTATIGDTVFFDTDGDGIQDSGEPGIPGVVVTISSDFDNDGQVESFQVTTDATGNYSLPQLPAATWTVTVTTPSGATPTTDFSGDSVGDATSTFALAAGEQKLDRDFGFRGASSIGDRVWLDRNSNGTQDSGELGIVGTAVALDIDFDSNGSYDATFSTTTGANGAYGFANLIAGNYRVRVTAPSGTAPTFDEDGLATLNSSIVTLPANTSHATADFGYVGTGAIGDFVWFDVDGDGAQDANEPGLPNVTVQLQVDFNGDNTYDGTLSTLTDLTGGYSFAGLPAGSYRVSIPTPPAFSTQTYDLDNTLDNASLETLTAGESALNHDFGYQGSGSIGDYVWFDRNGDGVQDASEPGIANVTVTLTIDLNGDSIADYTASKTTDSSGNYSFANLIPGDYLVSVTAASVPASMANHPTFDADGVGTPNQSSVTLSGPSNLSNANQDFGYNDTGVIGDTIFFDYDGNGIQDAGEPGWPNVTVTLSGDFDNDSIVESFTTTTDASGKYSFDHLPAGSWTVTVTAPSNATPTTDFSGDSIGDLSSTFTLLDGQIKNDRDFGLRGISSIGDRVWFDADADSVQDVGEPGIPNVLVQLQVSLDGDSNYETTFTTTTNASGAYAFSNLPAGAYRISIPTPPAGSTQTYDLNGALDNASTAVLTSNQTTTTHDFGYRGNGVIGDLVWFDQDGDAFHDGFEPGIANVKVTLTIDLDGNGTADYTTSTITDANGGYQFTNLLHGVYTISVDTSTLPAGMSSFPTFDVDGINSPNTAIVSLSAAPNDSSLLADFGYRGNGKLGDTVFFDYDLDGVQDPGEPGMPNVTVTLSGDFDGDTLSESFVTTTDSNGKYQFANLSATIWTVTVSAPTGTSPTTDLDGDSTFDLASTVTLNTSQTLLDRDFGLIGSSTIGNRIWFDANADGTQDPGEPGLPLVPVRLSVDLDNDAVYETSFDTTTDANGLYQFTNLPAGNYRITVVTPPAFTNQTFDFDGTLDNSSQETLTAGETANGHDFGYVGTGAIGDFVWFDRNGDGVQDPLETELSDVDLTLELDVNGDSTPDYTATATTDVAGLYSFVNLIPGTYTISVVTSTLPAGMATHPTFDADGTATPSVSIMTLSGPGALSNSSQDFGYRGTGQLGDTVFLDINGNGVQDLTEAGIPAVIVTISIDTDGDGTVESFQTITDASGNYTFDNLPPGQWTISVTPPTGTTPTTDFSGDSIGDSSAVYTLADGETKLTFDFGFQGNASIGDRVWWDADADGVQDASEFGIPGVTIELDIDTNSDGTYENTISTTSGVNGVYLFDSLADGKYRVRVTPPVGTTPTYDEDGVGTANATLVTVTTGVSHLTADFGYQGAGSLGNLVWFDADGDGIVDAGEPGLPGVPMTLSVDFNGDNVIDGVLTTSTNGSGQYGFANLPAGNYVVTATPLAFSVQTYDLDGTLDNASSEVIGAGESAQNHDFGYRGTGTIGDLVWFDQDNDGFEDAFEPGLANVTVTMSIDFNGDNSPDYTASSTTDPNGGYSFGNLLPGAYPILITTATLPAGMATHPTFDSDGTATPHRSTVTLAGPNSLTNLLQDFGYRGTGAIGDTVFFDYDGNGSQDGNEPGMAGVVVTAASDIDGDGNLESFQTTTDSAGNYSFENLTPGTWTISITPPADTTPSTDLSGDGVPDVSHTFTLADGELNNDQDFGLRGSASIGDRLWFDADANGLQDSGEPGLPGVPLQLLADIDGDGVYEATFSTTTNGSGAYSFTHLLAGDYVVEVLTPPAETVPTFDLDGGLDNQAARALNSNTTADDVDFGYAGIGSIGDTVWFDQNGNGLQDGEPGLDNVTVSISIDLNADSIVDYTTSTTTDATGVYVFSNLIPGTYVVSVTGSSLPAGMSTHPTFDADGVGSANQSTAILSTAAGMTNSAQDFGYRGGGAIGDTVFFDYDLNGTQAPGEPGIANVTVTLSADLDGNGTTETFETTTDNNGHYSFNGLPAVDWTVSIAAPIGTFPTTDLDGNGTKDLSNTIALNVDQQRLDQDFGLRGDGSIGNLVWFDADANQLKDGNEAGLPGITVTLAVDINGDGNIEATFTTLTDSLGGYAFPNLPAGEYTISILSPPSFTVQTFDANGALDNQSTEVLSAGENALNHDFGYRGNGSIGDLVWFDVNGNGTRDANEPGIGNVQLTLGLTVTGDNSPEYTVTTTTDATGAYAFNHLIPGAYVVTVNTATLPAGMATNPTYDSDGLATLHSSDLTLAGPNSLTNNLQDFGYRGAGAIGDTVFFDYDGDGIQDANESGMSGVTVTLSSDFDADGDVDSFTTVTDSSGKYSFTNLPAANWTVTVTAPSGTVPTTDFTGDSVGDLSSTITLAVDQTRNDRDYGLRGNGVIGDLVWFDANANSVRNAGEPGLPNVTIRLDVDLNTDGTYETFFTTTTNSSGSYSFANLPAGTYRISVPTPPAFSVQTYDLNGALDNSSTEALTVGETANGHDFGYRGTGSIGDRIWFDANNNGAQDSGEPGIANVQVTLTLDVNADNVTDYTVAAVTDASGNYSFGDLLPGTYTITVNTATLPAGMAGQPTFDADGTNTAHTSNVSLAGPGALTNNLQDFSYRGTGSIGNTIFFDLDADGVQDLNEPGIPGIVVTLTADFDSDGIGETLTTTTGANGSYVFTNLPPATWVVAVAPPSGTTPTSDFTGDGTGDASNNVPLASGQARVDQNFGFVGTGQIGDRVWNDSNANGVQDVGEAPINGLTVNLDLDFDSDGTFDATLTTLTSGNGDFLFATLPAGAYRVRVTPPVGMTPTYDSDGTATPNQALLALGPNATNYLQDFGYVGTGSLAWEKRAETTGTPLLAGATFVITPNPRTGVGSLTVVDGAIDDADSDAGQFLVQRVIPGSYVITETVAPSGYRLDDDPTRAVTVTFADPNQIVGTQGVVDLGNTDESDFINPRLGVIVVSQDKSPATPQYVRILDRTTGTELSKFVPYETNYTGGIRIAVGDLTGDGIDEIVTAPGRSRNPEIRVFTQAGVELTAFRTMAYPTTNQGGVQLALGDVNGDGKLDIVTVPTSGNAEVRVWYNQSPAADPIPNVASKTFTAFVGAGGGTVTVADMGRMNGTKFINSLDGKAEIVVASGPGAMSSVKVYSNVPATPTVAVTFAPFGATSAYMNGMTLSTARIDSDLFPDIIVSSENGNNSDVRIWKWNGSATAAALSQLGALQPFGNTTSKTAPVRTIAIDTTGDGIAETLVATQGPGGTANQIRQFTITNTAPFAVTQTTPIASLAGPFFVAELKNPSAPAPAPKSGSGESTSDVPSDDALDVDRDGQITPRDMLTIVNALNSGTSPAAPAVADVDGDGQISPRDALYVVNYLNNQTTAGEGETVDRLFAQNTDGWLADDELLMADLADEIARRRKTARARQL